MTITPRLFDAFLKCPTKCWLRARNETPSGNAYAEWVLSQNESYRATQIERLLVETPPDQSARSPDPQKLKASKWLLAVDVVARTSATPRSSRREEAPSENSTDGARSADSHLSLVASAATPLTAASAPFFAVESRLHAVERVPADGRGKAAQFIPIRCHFFNKLTKDDKLLLAFDAFVLAQELGRDIAVGKIIHGDPRHCVRSSRGNEAPSENAECGTRNTESSQSLLTSAATPQIGPGAGIKAPTTLISAASSEAQPRVTKVKTSALAGEVRKRLEKLAALLTSQGDILLCYLTGAMRWVGALQVLEHTNDRSPIWTESEFPERLEVKPIIVLEPEHGVPMSELAEKAPFYRNAASFKRFRGFLRASPKRFKNRRDGEMILRMLYAAERTPDTR